MKCKSVLIIVVSLLVATILGIGFYVEQSFKSETQVPTMRPEAVPSIDAEVKADLAKKAKKD